MQIICGKNEPFLLSFYMGTVAYGNVPVLVRTFKKLRLDAGQNDYAEKAMPHN